MTKKNHVLYRVVFAVQSGKCSESEQIDFMELKHAENFFKDFVRSIALQKVIWYNPNAIETKYLKRAEVSK
jgi:hypothetical protein